MSHERRREKYAIVACNACKRSRRKCNGQNPCILCSQRGIECVYEQPHVLTAENVRQSRPVAWVIMDNRRPNILMQVKSIAMENALLKAEEEQLRAAISHLQHQRPKLNPLAAQGVLTIHERGILRSYFSSTDLLLPVVDEGYFFGALAAAEKGYSGEVLAAVEYASLDVDNHDSLAPHIDPRIVGDALGLALCTSVLLCIGSKLEVRAQEELLFTWRHPTITACRVQGRHARAAQYYERARAGVAPAYRHPSRHLVSALLLMTILTRAVCPDECEPIAHAALARRLIDAVPDVSPGVRLAAAMLSFALAPTRGGSGVVWPSAQAPVGQCALQCAPLNRVLSSSSRAWSLNDAPPLHLCRHACTRSPRGLPGLCARAAHGRLLRRRPRA